MAPVRVPGPIPAASQQLGQPSGPGLATRRDAAPESSRKEDVLALQTAHTKGLGTFRHVPEKDWHDVGNATFEAALETFLWACARGDIDRVASLIQVSPPPKDFDASVRSMSADFPENYGTPEKMAALMLVYEHGGVNAMLIETTLLSETSAHLRTRFIYGPDNHMAGVPLWLQQTPDGAKLVVSSRSLSSWMAADPKSRKK